MWCLALNQRQIATRSNILLLCLSNLFFKFYIVRKLAVSQQCCDNSRDVGRRSILWRLMVVLKKKWLNCFPCSTPSDLKRANFKWFWWKRTKMCRLFYRLNIRIVQIFVFENLSYSISSFRQRQYFIQVLCKPMFGSSKYFFR